MKEYLPDEFFNAPLEVGAVYRGTSNFDTVSAMMRIGNQGGFRNSKSDGDLPAFSCIFSNGAEEAWKDIIDTSTGLVTYYGDNKKAGNDKENTHNKGNAILSECFDYLHKGEYDKIIPFLIFQKPTGSGFEKGRNWIFRGLAVPGVKGLGPGADLKPISVGDGDEICENYEAHLTILNEKVIDKAWLFKRKFINSHHELLAPPSWKNFIKYGLDGVDPYTGDSASDSSGDTFYDDDCDFFKYLCNHHLFFNIRMVEDFLLSLKAKQFLILSGGSGTGKTSLAQAYCQFIQSGYHQLVPVGSNWTDNRNVVGYMNMITGKYVSTSILELLKHSIVNSTDPHFIILDEMNLSHVERYFSDFLSAIESGEPISTGSLDEDVPKSIQLGDNLFVIGTVNMDETTYSFSPKVLDRANVLEFDTIRLDSIIGSEDSTENPPKTVFSSKLKDSMSVSANLGGDVDFLQDCFKGLEVRGMTFHDVFDNMNEVVLNIPITNEMIVWLSIIQGCMDSMNLPFGYRTLDEFMRFMYVAWVYEYKGEFKNWTRYFDSQVMEKILPKIHGNQSISKGLNDLHQFCKAKNLSRSEHKTERMIHVLDGQRYVSFDC